jgi:excisionase family DNA binding protein
MPSAGEPKRLLSPQQVADLTGLNVEVLRRAIRCGELRASKLCSRLRVHYDDYEAWLERNRVVMP